MRPAGRRRFARIAARAGTDGTLEDRSVRDLKAFIATDDPEALEVAREFVDYVRARNRPAQAAPDDAEAEIAPTPQSADPASPPREEQPPAAPPSEKEPSESTTPEARPTEARPLDEGAAFEEELRTSAERRQAWLDEHCRWRPRGEPDPYYWNGDDDAGAGYGGVIVDYDPLAADDDHD